MAETTTRFRPARIGDEAEIARIWFEGWRDGHVGHVPVEVEQERSLDSFQARTPGRLATTTVAEVASLGAGFVMAGFVMVVDDELEQVYVDRNFRGLGVATAVLAEGVRRVAAGGYSSAWLAVVAGNARARRFYEREGWHDEGNVDYEAGIAGGGSIVVASRRYRRQIV